MFISRPFKPRCDCDDSDEWRISFSRRISSPTGEFLGVAVASMRMSYFDQLFNSLDIGNGSTLGIINDDGILLAQKPYRAKTPSAKASPAVPTSHACCASAVAPLNSVSSVDHQRRLYTFTRVGNLPLTVIVALSSRRSVRHLEPHGAM